MPSQYTCRACLQATSKLSSVFARTKSRPQYRDLFLRTSQRSLSTTTPTSYRASYILSADKPTSNTSPKAATVPLPYRSPYPKPKESTQDASSRSKSPSVASQQTGISAAIASRLRTAAPNFTETYVAYGGTEQLIQKCIDVGQYEVPQALEKNGVIPTDENGTHIGVGSGWWYETLNLTPTFTNWSQITFIHIWLMQTRFRNFPTTHSGIWIQHLTNHFFFAAEDRMVVYHKLTATSQRQSKLKDLFAQWRAVLLSYDEGLAKGDAVLAAAVWRNIFASNEDVDFEKLAQIVAYMRRQVVKLDQTSDNDLMMGRWEFEQTPADEATLVKRRAEALR